MRGNGKKKGRRGKERQKGGGTHHRQAQDHRAPETDIVKDALAFNPSSPLQHDDGQLQHHGHEAVAAEFLSDARHDDLVANSADEEGDERGHGLREMRAGCSIDMAAKEMVDRDIPLSGKFEPVDAVPPVRVELAVCKAC